MKFTTLLRKVILENAQSKFDILFDKFTKPSVGKDGTKLKPKLTKEEFFKLVQADPTTRLNNVDLMSASPDDFEKVKAGKYVPWIIKHYLSPKTEIPYGEYGYERDLARAKDLYMEDLYKITDDLIKFERFKSKVQGEKDINKLTPEQLYDAVKDFDINLAKTTKSERKSAPVHPGASLIYDGDNWRVVEIRNKEALGKEAACFYGGYQKETRWCTSAPGLTYFERYIKDGPLYVVYNPNNPKIAPETGLPVERYQFHFPSNQFMDKDDRQIDLVQYLNGPMEELKQMFKPEFAKGLTTSDKKLFIDGFNQGAVGKFIGLYGLDDLIASLPDSLEKINISNRDKSNVILKLPKAITRFKNLDMIYFENCIDEVPDFICELKNLEYMAFVDCKNITTIPECVGNMENLIFLNMKGSDNVKIPNSVKQRAANMGDNMWDFDV